MIEVPEGRPSFHALKPLPIQDDLHGPEGPLLHGCANIPEFFKQTVTPWVHSRAASRLRTVFPLRG